jgi:hypothetical protein
VTKFRSRKSGKGPPQQSETIRHEQRLKKKLFQRDWLEKRKERLTSGAHTYYAAAQYVGAAGAADQRKQLRNS